MHIPSFLWQNEANKSFDVWRVRHKQRLVETQRRSRHSPESLASLEQRIQRRSFCWCTPAVWRLNRSSVSLALLWCTVVSSPYYLGRYQLTNVELLRFAAAGCDAFCELGYRHCWAGGGQHSASFIRSSDSVGHGRRSTLMPLDGDRESVDRADLPHVENKRRRPPCNAICPKCRYQRRSVLWYYGTMGLNKVLRSAVGLP